MTFPDRRKRLLKLLSDIEQSITEAVALTVDVTDDELLQQASAQLAELHALWKTAQKLLVDLDRV